MTLTVFYFYNGSCRFTKTINMRNKTIFSLFFLLSFFHLSAQVENGQLYGDFIFGKRILKLNTGTIQPAFSIGLNEHSTFGVFYDYTRSKTTPSISSNGYFVNQGVGISYSYYHYFKKSQKWGWYFNSSFAINQTRAFDKSSGSLILKSQSAARILSVTPGVFFKPSKGVMLFANIGGVSLVNNRYHFITPSSSFASQLNLGIRINIGGLRKNKKTDR